MSEERPHPSPAEDRPARSWTPPVNREFERYGEAFFISLAPPFMPRWLLHAEPSNVSGTSADIYTLIELFRPAVTACLALATWCLRKSWTVSVERRDIAGVADWRFVLREEYRSFTEAVGRRDEIVENWRGVVFSDWRGGNYTPVPFIDEVTADRPQP